MKACGVICEFNPFHGGHAYLLGQLRRAGAEVIVCVMSGSFVQRGESAVADKFARARCAIEGGADVVLELPFPYCMASAEYFARAGVGVLDRFGVDALGFGCESGDEASLAKAAEILLSEQFAARYRQLCREGEGGAAAYFAAYREVAGRPLSDSPNDILAVNYVKELRRRGSRMAVLPVRRRGDGYGQTEPGGEFPSAMALRILMREGGVDALTGHVPEAVRRALEGACKAGLCMSRIENIERAIISYLRVCDANAAARDDAPGESCGLDERICAAAREAGNYDELIALASAANFTDARIRRAVLNLMLGVTREDMLREPAYLQLLAASRRGRAYLAERRRAGGIPVVTKPADAAGVAGGARQWQLAQRSEALWCMTLPRPLPASTLTLMHPYFEKE